VFPQTVPPPFTAVVGDARDLSRFPDQCFDVVYSNSVIGHVGSRRDQAQMAREVRRVGRMYVLQTPNHYFPIDWRTLVPGFHWLPATWQAWAFLHLRVGKYARTADPEVAWEWATRVRNLTRTDLQEFFPDGTILPERLAGFTKSFVVLRKNSQI
jgi:ubiquinone/menaquinone biosynthesis C-methylase UbiE